MSAKKKKKKPKKKKAVNKKRRRSDNLHSMEELTERERELMDELQRVREAEASAKSADEVNQKLGMLHKAVDLMERSRVSDYMMLVNRPLKLIWVNLLAGLSRGVGFFFGTVLLSFVLLYVLGKFLGWIYDDVGGLPWIGTQLQDFIAWLLDIIKQAESAKPGNGGGNGTSP